jgi:phosphate transport system permease protein
MNPFRSPAAGGQRTPRWGDRIFAVITGIGAAAILGLLVGLVIILAKGATLTFDRFGASFLWISVWDPIRNTYGVAPFALGTLLTSAIALLIAVPLALGAAIFLTQQAPVWLRTSLGQLIELLASIPSIVYGFWGLVILVPIMRYQVEPFFQEYFRWTGAFNGPATGLDVFTASVILAIMIIPTVAAVSRESILAVPVSQREAAPSLGIFGGIALGLGRALGETMAVTLVIGNRNAIPGSLLAQGQTIASLIVNEFTEASGPYELSALIEAGLVLVAITLAVNIGARLVLRRFQHGWGAPSE